MKKLLVLLFFPVSFCFAQEIALDMADVPSDVLKSFITLYPEHGNSRWTINSKQHYVVRTEINKHKAMVVFKSDGSFMLIDEKIPVEDASDSAKAFFKSHHADINITCCNRVKTYKNDTYEMMSGYYNNDMKMETYVTYPKEMPLSFLDEREFLK